MLKIENLTKRYKNSEKAAVSDLSLELNPGEIFGFIGKNGAGKSTTIKCATGILSFDSGRITVGDHDITEEPKKAKMLIGYVPDNHAVYEKMTAREYITFMGILYGVSREDVKTRSDYYLKKFDLADVADHQIRSFSHGMKQKVSVIAAIVHDPKLWILDEPLTGLDPQAAAEIKSFMLFYSHELGNTIFFSSHDIDLVEKICDRVAIIRDGVIVARYDEKPFVRDGAASLEDHFFNYQSGGTEAQ